MRWIVLVPIVAALLPHEVAATTVHKCARSDGTVAYQGGPCARGQRVLEKWEVAPDPVLAPRRVARSASTGAETVRRPGPSRRRGWDAAPPDPCREAKRRRDEIERRVGLARTYELLSSLQREVYDACR